MMKSISWTKSCDPHALYDSLIAGIPALRPILKSGDEFPTAQFSVLYDNTTVTLVYPDTIDDTLVDSIVKNHKSIMPVPINKGDIKKLLKTKIDAIKSISDVQNILYSIIDALLPD